MGWRCQRCARIVRGEAPIGPLVCGECPEPLATPEEVLASTDETGAPLSDSLGECRECGAWIRRTNRLPPGQSRCMPCAIGRRVRCEHPAHKGERSVMAHQAQLGAYVYRTKAGKVFQRKGVLCHGCFISSNAVCPSELSSQPGLAILPELPFTLESPPRARYSKDYPIFDTPGIRGEGERRVIRLSRDSVASGEYQGKFLQWIECEEYRPTPQGTVELRNSVSFNRRLLRAIRRQVEAKRATGKPHATHADLGWVLAECIGLDPTGRQVFRISYPSPNVGETVSMWAAKVLIPRRTA